jgi:tripartite-type tricarboxylate transporter receptor subunit TctC
MLKHILALAGLGILTLAPSHAQQSDVAHYPSRTVKIIATVPAGGGVDIVTRLLADKLQQKFGQPFIVENRGGASGNIGAEAVSAAAPDGYTLMASQPAPLTTNAALYKKLSFDAAAFAPVAIMSKIPNVLLVRRDFPARTAQEFIAYAKANPGKLNFASQGTGTTSHLTAELFQALTGTRLVHVPYRGTGPALNDLVAGHVDLIFMELAVSYKLHEGGKARILAAATERRLPVLPDIPTMMEAGVKDFVSDTWNAVSAPPKTPAAIVARLNGAINEILETDEVRARFKALLLAPGGGTPQQMRAFVQAETRRWGEVIRAAGIRPE